MAVKKENKKYKYLQLALKLTITAVALYFVFRKIELDKLLTYYKTADLLYLFIALTAFVMGQFISALRLNVFFRKIDLYVSDRSNFKLYLLGMFYNVFLPGGIGGDAYKIYLLKKKFNYKIRSLFWCIFTDRLIGLLVLFCLAVFLFLFLPGYGRFQWYACLLIPLAILVYHIFIRQFLPQFKGIFFDTFSQSFFIQVLQLFCALFILFAFGISEEYVSYLFLFLISSIVASLPITIGGVGAREITFLYGAEMLGLNTNLSVALSFMFYIMTLLTSLSGIYFSLDHKKIAL